MKVSAYILKEGESWAIWGLPPVDETLIKNCTTQEVFVVSGLSSELQ